MANRTFNRLQGTLETGVVVLPGTVTFLSSSVFGRYTSDTIAGVSSSYQGTGIVRQTLADSYARLMACNLTLETTGTENYRLQLSGANVTGAAVAGPIPAKTIDFNVVSGTLGSTVKVNPEVNSKAHVVLFLKNSGLPQDK